MRQAGIVTAVALAFGVVAAPVGGMAKDTHPGKGNGHGKQARVETRIEGQKDRAPQRVRVQNRGIVVADCAPGLAKKDPACVPPGLAKKGLRQGVVVGDIYDLDDIHIITQPGRYGLGEPPAGNSYAIVDGRLVRVDSNTGRLLSIIRLVDAILD